MDLNSRFDLAVKRRDQLNIERHKLEARLELSQNTLRSVEEECRNKGIDPDNIDSIILNLQKRHEDLVTEIESQVRELDAAIAPLMKEIR